MRIRSFIVTLPLCFLLVACGSKAVDTTIAQGGKKLSTDEISTLVGGNTMLMEEYGLKATVECFLDGKLLGRNSENVKTGGRWQIDEQGQLCLRYKRLGGVEDYCSSIYQVGEEYRQFTPNGALTGTFTIQEGNSRDTAGASNSRPKPRATKSGSSSTPTSSTQQEPSQAYNYLPPPEIHTESDIRFLHLEMAQNCPGCNLAGVDLEGARLLDANLPGADLRQARLRNSNLRSANLRGANLERADLRGANLAGANLAGANLAGADLTDANLTRADLKGANLDNVRGADLSNAFR
ncbi:pentapeptide repeat-containing protein [Thermodesulfobacteriota bacterium]